MAAIVMLGLCSPGFGQCDRWYGLTAGGQTGVGAAAVEVKAMTVWNGHLIVGGLFTTAGGQTVNNIARWDGAAWFPLTSGGQIGLNERVNALTVWNGELIAGGDFTTAGGQTVNNIARWNGSTWQPLTSGGQIGLHGSGTESARALTVWNNQLVVGGTFQMAGGLTVRNIARWNGTAWSAFESGFNSSVYALTVWNGTLYAGGVFQTDGTGFELKRVAFWNGSVWEPLVVGGTSGLNTSVDSLVVWNGQLVLGGKFTTSTDMTSMRYITRWNGTAWLPFVVGANNGMDSWTEALTVWNGQLIAGGLFTNAGGVLVNNIARWTGTTWQTISSRAQTGVNQSVLALAVWNGDLIAGGTFATAGGQTVNGIARWDGCAPCPADINHSGGVDTDDLLTLLGSWGSCAGCPADINSSGAVDTDDLLTLLGGWGPCP